MSTAIQTKGRETMGRNKEVREEMRKTGITQWRLGELLGVSENTVNRKLRKELPEEEKQRILAVIRKEGETVVSD